MHDANPLELGHGDGLWRLLWSEGLLEADHCFASDGNASER
jgi:hypothetical protein